MVQAADNSLLAGYSEARMVMLGAGKCNVAKTLVAALPGLCAAWHTGMVSMP